LRILQRYMLREMTVNFIGVTVVLFAILFVNQVGAVLARAAQLQYQSGFVLELIGLGAAQNVAILLPIGLLLGIVLAFGGSITIARWRRRRPAASAWAGSRPPSGCWRCR
jgi:lipopolysaccharide export LptBFGC system permease protein LptF